MSSDDLIVFYESRDCKTLSFFFDNILDDVMSCLKSHLLGLLLKVENSVLESGLDTLDV